MDDAIDLANLAGGLKGDDEQRRVAAGIAIAAVAVVPVLDMTLRSKACPENAGTATAKYKGRCGFPLSFENAA
jgi:hypothetical protein